jgi:hypothetical protein
VTATRQNARAWWLVLLLVSAFTPSCNRLGAVSSGDKSASVGNKRLPFHSDAGTEQGAPGDAVAHPSLSAEGKDALPFRSPSRLRILPSGTLITVRLERSLDSAEVHAGDPFTAVVADPVMIDGDTLVARGAIVTGVIESTQQLSVQRSSGYIRLTLNDITIDGKRLPLQTSSLFAQGTSRPPEDPSTNASGLSGVRLQPGRRLTFRLTLPATLNDQNALAREYAIPSTE